MSVEALGQITLPVYFGLGSFARTEDIVFDVVDTSYQYNAIFGRRLLNAFYAVPHHGFLCMKMSGPREIIKVLEDQKVSRLIDVGRASRQREVNELWPGKEPEQASPTTTRYVPKARPGEGIKEVVLREESPEKTVKIVKSLPPSLEEDLVAFLWENEDVFAWSPSDLQGVSRDLIEHHLRIDPKKRPHKQKVRKMSAERKEAAKEEVRKLLEANVIREVVHNEWLANPVLVKKSNGK